MARLGRQLVRAARHPARTAAAVVQGAERAVGAQGPEIVDVWSRTQPKYRRRAVLLLLINAGLFAGLNVFAFWLHHARLFDFSWASYVQAVVGKSLADFVQYPINVQQVPLMMVILGLLLGVMIAVPIVVAQLYRFPTSLLFVAQVCFLGHLPTLAGFLLLGCYIAGGARLRLSFRFASSSLALIPIVVYFLIATKGVDLSDADVQVGLFATVLVTVLVVGTAMLIAYQGRRSLSGQTLGLIVFLGLIPTVVWVSLVPHQQELLLDPAARVMTYAPWLLAVVSACVFSAAVLLIAWIVNYRPGAIAPVLAVLFAVPVGLFESKVGRDELQYRVLEAEYGPRSRTRFRPQDVKERIFELAQRRWLDDHRSDVQALMDNIKLVWEFELEPLGDVVGQLKKQAAENGLTALAREQYEVMQACDEFCQSRPQSRYIPNVLYIKARAMDMRVDIARFRREGLLSFYDDFPNPASEQTWETLLANCPDSPLASVAMYKLAIFRGREVRVPEAISLLRGLIDRFGARGNQAREPEVARWSQVFARKPPASTLDVQLPMVVERARELLELLEANGEDPIYGYAPVAELLQLDARSTWYDEQLAVMLKKYERSSLADNLSLRLALTAESLSRRISSLQDLLGRYARGDVAAEGLFRLGELLEADARPEESRATYSRLIEEHPESVWATRAVRRLGQLELRSVLP